MLSMYVRLFFNICTPEGIIASIHVSLHIYSQNSFNFYFFLIIIIHLLPYALDQFH